MNRGGGLVLLIVLLCSGLGCQAQTGMPLRQASASELVDRLAPPASSGGLTRSLRNLQPKTQSVDLLVPFDYDSARLRPESLPILESLSQALLSDRLSRTHFTLEGHTDATGSADYNQQLSERRARSVQDFLLQRGVPAERLSALGKGFTELLLPLQPDAAENRRVRVLATPDTRSTP